MKDESLNFKREFINFEKTKKLTGKSENLFVVSSLENLQKMQALIKKNGLKNNVLVFLYNYKQINVVNNIKTSISISLFIDIIFVKIPHGLQKPNLKKNIKLNKIYKKILSLSKFKSLYVNEFYGHYNIILSLAESKKINLILVEGDMFIYSLRNISLSHKHKIHTKINIIKDSFTNTVSQSLLAKKIARWKKEYRHTHSFKSAWRKTELSIKDFRLIKQVCSLFSKFINQIWNSYEIQSKAVNIYKKLFPIVSYTPFVTFNEVYAFYPEKVDNTFKNINVKPFSFNDFLENEISNAKIIAEKYNIVSNDILFISQSHEFDLRLYMREVYVILSNLAIERRVFIKLHNTENETIQIMYQKMSKMSGGKIILLNSAPHISPELLISVSPIEMVIGLTSNSLISLLSMKKDLRIISIAKFLIYKLSWSNECKIEILKLSNELEVLERFKKIIFYENTFMENINAK